MILYLKNIIKFNKKYKLLKLWQNNLKKKKIFKKRFNKQKN